MIKVGIIQTRGYRTNEEGIRRVSKLLDQAGKKRVEIVCLPEQWLKENVIKNFDSEFSEFRKIAKNYQMTIIPGAFYTKVKSHFQIVAPVIGPTGEIIGIQEKIHPFDYEKKIVIPGKEAKIFKTSCSFGILICYDMVFPIVAEKFVKKGAKILFSPSRIVKRGIEPWKTYVQARSLENRVPILASNVENQKYGGHSMIVDLIEKDKVMIPKITKIYGEGIIIKQFDLKNYEKNRKKRFLDSREFF